MPMRSIVIRFGPYSKLLLMNAVLRYVDEVYHDGPLQGHSIHIQSIFSGSNSSLNIDISDEDNIELKDTSFELPPSSLPDSDFGPSASLQVENKKTHNLKRLPPKRNKGTQHRTLAPKSEKEKTLANAAAPSVLPLDVTNEQPDVPSLANGSPQRVQASRGVSNPVIHSHWQRVNGELPNQSPVKSSLTASGPTQHMSPLELRIETPSPRRDPYSHLNSMQRDIILCIKNAQADYERMYGSLEGWEGVHLPIIRRAAKGSRPKLDIQEMMYVYKELYYLFDIDGMV
jgi:hypothetical protein